MAQNSQLSGQPELNYFVCTLGEAATINKQNPHVFNTVNEFLDRQARVIPQNPAVGFPTPSNQIDNNAAWQYKIFTFEDLRRGSVTIGQALSKSLHGNVSLGKTVALLAPSSIDFLFAWLGLMRLGCSVLLIAPQCQPLAIAHLCKSCNVSSLFYDETYEALAEASAEASDSELPLRVVHLPRAEQRDKLLEDATLAGDLMSIRAPLEVSDNHVAYLHHTSGTSTGLPKPIPQSHCAAVGVLPCLETGHDRATFTTTPLYHGGVADCFRAWTSNAMIWLFPGKEVPITTQNVLKSLNCAGRSKANEQTAPVAYFSCVPYVLQMVAADDDGLHMLRSMEIVGVGGAALPQGVGDDLVRKGVNLISRFGSAECGFLMSSHRDYTTDKQWQYLRSNESTALSFETQEDGLAELVILPQWPHMAKRNRNDGSFATADLFAAHSTISHAWKYHSRADSQLTLITGKKFDPAPLEAAIAASPLLNDVLIFGNGQQFPGALLFRSSLSLEMSHEQLLERMWPTIEKLNVDTQGHARLSKSMLIVMSKDAPVLEKSSKGTTMRAVAEESFQGKIKEAYEGISVPDSTMLMTVSDHEIPITVLEIVKSVTGTKDTISEDADLFSFGVDSVACMQIRALLQSKILSPNMPKLPLNVVYDCGTIKRLSKYLLNIRNGQITEKEDEVQLMLDLVQEYSSFPTRVPGIEIYPSQTTKPTIILTGATGSLGAHILSLLLSHPLHPHITCLVRAATPSAAYARVSKSLLTRHLPPVTQDSHLTCLPVKFSESHLGLSEEVYSSLAANVTSLIHAAWAVNFRTTLRSFIKDHILGLRNLISLVLSSLNSQPPKFIFCSSTASVTSSHSPIKESISLSPLTASLIGYSRSKWVAEAICARAWAETKMRGRVVVARVGQLCGDRERGVWNASEAWPLMISSVKVTGSLPDLAGEVLDWLPVDVAAAAIVQICSIDLTKFADTESKLPDGGEEIPVYHILNPHHTPSWSDLLHWLRSLHPNFTVLSPKAWVEALENLTGEEAGHPAKKLLGLWREAYCGDDSEHGERGVGAGSSADKTRCVFETDITKAAVPVMRDVQAIDEELFGKIWSWIDGEMIGGGEA